MVYQTPPEQFTPREHEQMRYDEEQEKRQIEYNLRLKEMDIEVAKLEAKWTSWLRLPIYVIRIPLLVILGIAYIVHAIRGIEPSESFWRLLK